MEAERIGIVELFERVEAFKEADPRKGGTLDEVVSLYADVSEIIREAGWGAWEYEAALCSVYA